MLAHHQGWQGFKSGLHIVLERLGESLNEIFVKKDLGTLLNVAQVTPLLGNSASVWHGGASAGTGQGGSAAGISQLSMVPALPKFFDFRSPGKMHEEMYLHVLLMMSAAVNGRFQQKVKDVAARITGQSTADGGAAGPAPIVMSVAPKSFIRAKNKSISKEDYRDKPKPRSANCVDTVRNLVCAQTPEMIKLVVGALCEEFGGAAKCKNLFALSAVERGQRFHLSSLMLTLPFNTGVTFGELARDPAVRQAWDEYEARSERPHARWSEHCRAARAYLETKELSTMQAGLYCEVQVMLSDFVDVRSSMHEVYKAWRAENHLDLASDFMRSVGRGAREPDPVIARAMTQEAGVRALTTACMHGLLHEAEDALQFLQPHFRYGNNHDVWLHILRQAILATVMDNHIDVMAMLIDRSPPLQQLFPRSDTVMNGGDPVSTAAQEGSTEMVRLLLMRGAYPDGMSAAGSGSNSYITPMLAACQKGFDDVVALLVDLGGVSVQGMRGDPYNPPIYPAAQGGRVDVVAVLLDRGANIEGTNAKRNTALHISAGSANVAMVELLLSRGARVDALNSQKRTALGYASCAPTIDGKSQEEHDANRRIVIKMLLDHGADLNHNGDYGTPLQEAVDDCCGDAEAYLRSLGARAEKSTLMRRVESGQAASGAFLDSMGAAGATVPGQFVEAAASNLEHSSTEGGMQPPGTAPNATDPQLEQLLAAVMPNIPPNLQQQLLQMKQQGASGEQRMVYLTQSPYIIGVAQRFGTGQQAMAEAFQAIVTGQILPGGGGSGMAGVVPPAPDPAQQEGRINQLKTMGFDQDRARAALMQYNWNVEEAIAALLG